jgi:hypothetical protein
MVVSGQLHPPATLLLGKIFRYSLTKKMGGFRKLSEPFEGEKNFLPLPGIEIRFPGRPAREDAD